MVVIVSAKYRTWLSQRRGALTQQRVAEMAGISRSYYTEIEAADKNPSVSAAKRLGEALEFDWIIFFEDEKKVPGKCRAGCRRFKG